MNKYKRLLENTLIFAAGQTGAKILSFFLIRIYNCRTDSGRIQYSRVIIQYIKRTLSYYNIFNG